MLSIVENDNFPWKMVLISYFLYTENPACESVATATDLGTKFGKENEARASIRGRAKSNGRRKAETPSRRRAKSVSLEY